MIRNDVIHSRIEIDTNLQAIADHVTLHKAVSLCSNYIPPDVVVTHQDLNRFGGRIEKLCLLNDGSHTYLHPGHGSFSAIEGLTICDPD